MIFGVFWGKFFMVFSDINLLSFIFSFFNYLNKIFIVNIFFYYKFGLMIEIIIEILDKLKD